MAKSTTTFSCIKCGAAHKKWVGRCDACSEWNSIIEEAPLAAGPAGKTLGKSKGRKIALGSLSQIDAPLERIPSGISEFDRVLGGGMVPASAILVGGTLLVRRDLGVRMPQALDQEYRDREGISCGETMAISMKAGSVGAVLGAVLGLLAYELLI